MMRLLTFLLLTAWAFAHAASTSDTHGNTAQNIPRTITITDNPDIPAKDISKSLRKLRKECPNVTISNDASNSDYTLAVTRRKNGGHLFKNFDLALFDRDGRTVIAASNDNLGDSVKDICHAIKTTVIVEVVDTQNLTQSQDTRRDTSGGVVGVIVNESTGRRTHTDTSTISVIVNNEHALLDCFEHRTGCTTIGPGKYYGQLDGGSIWINYQMPLTHQPVRNHYVIAGSW